MFRYISQHQRNSSPIDHQLSSIIDEYQVVSWNPPRASPTYINVYNTSQPAPNHNAGQIQFSPRDGYLYFSLGDGGANAHLLSQDLRSPMGKILRLDVDNPSGK